jgi:3-oxoacyl-[acyl-carrier-protein] synthase-1
MRECYFSGAALHTSLADSLAAHLPELLAGPRPAGVAAAEYAGKTQTLPYKLLARGAATDASHLPADQRSRFFRIVDHLVAAAIDAAQLTSAERLRMGLFIGTSSGDIGVQEHEYRSSLRDDPNALAMPDNSSLGGMALDLCRRFDLRGPDYSFNTACTASANALMYADAMVRSGKLDHALVLGLETFNAITALGFHGLQLLTPTAMRPFSPGRNGLVLGEGCSALVLSHRPTRPHPFRLIGSGNLCDTHSVSAANPDGSTVARVLGQALRAARLAPDDIAAIKTHGTASLLNDVAEAAGLHRVFTQMPPLTALKPFLGHTLGGCGLNELLLFCAAADEGFLIATPGIGIGDDSLGLTLNQGARELPRGRFMLNYFGFGGNNTSLIVANDAEAAA